MSADRFTVRFQHPPVYALNSRGGPKHDLARLIVDRSVERDCPSRFRRFPSSSWSSRAKDGWAPPEAADQVLDWLSQFETLAPQSEAVRAALEHAVAGRASYWDALLVETAAVGGCVAILSEDMRDGGRLGQVAIINPFEDDGLSPAAERLLQSET